MDKRVKLFIVVVISSFVLGTLVAFLIDYWKIEEAAFDKLLTFDFYQEKIIFSLVFGIFWVFITRWSDKRRKIEKE